MNVRTMLSTGLIGIGKRSRSILTTCTLAGILAVVLAPGAHAADGSKRQKAVTYPASSPPPMLSNIHYGKHERQELDFWKATSDQPTLLVFYIHGGASDVKYKNLTDYLIATLTAAGNASAR